jgi:hypothetical protein
MLGPDVFGANPYADSRPVRGHIVTVLRGIAEQRGLQLESYRSRTAQTGHIHELMVTDEEADPGCRVERVGLIGFFEVTSGGVILVGSAVRIAGRLLGTIAGFDDTHMPNHQNICVQVERILDGVALDLSVEDAVTIERI